MGKKNKMKGIVYSTNPDYEYDYGDEEQDTLPPSEQRLEVRREKKGRGGKQVCIIKNFIGTAEDLKDLGKLVKSKCGVGGSTKDGEIIIQGDMIQKVLEILHKEGYKAKKTGG